MKKTQKPSMRDRLKPLELVGFAAVLAAFAGFIVAIATRDFALRVPIAAGSAFIIALLVLALLGLSVKPNPEDKINEKLSAHSSSQPGNNNPEYPRRH